jgi:Cu(I)/Ag(I) efflux system periplasmic protein CusF
MRKLLAAIVALDLLVVGIGLAQPSMIDGQVTNIDQAAGKITIRHGPLKQFGMDDPMTMVYRADDPAVFKNVKAGDKIRFLADRINGQFTVIKIEKAR